MLKLEEKYQKIVDEYWKVHKQYVKSKRAKKFENAAELAIKMVKIGVKVSKAKYELDVAVQNALGTKKEIKLILQKKAGVLPKSEIKKWEKS